MKRTLELVCGERTYTVDLDPAAGAGGSTQVTIGEHRATVALERWQGPGAPRGGRALVELDGRRVEAWVVQLAGGTLQVGLPGLVVEVLPATLAGASTHARADSAHGTYGPVKSPITGKLVKVFVDEGQVVAAAQPLAVVEAMKMENEIRAPIAGKIGKIEVTAGQSIDLGQTLLSIDAPGED